MVESNTRRIYPTKADVEAFEMLSPMLAALTSELKELSKKKPDDPLNAFKVRTTNKVLRQLQAILSDQPEAQFLELLDDDTLPSYSDAVIMLAQYKSAVSQYRSRYYRKDPQDMFSEASWLIDETAGSE